MGIMVYSLLWEMQVFSSTVVECKVSILGGTVACDLGKYPPEQSLALFRKDFV